SLAKEVSNIITNILHFLISHFRINRKRQFSILKIICMRIIFRSRRLICISGHERHRPWVMNLGGYAFLLKKRLQFLSFLNFNSKNMERMLGIRSYNGQYDTLNILQSLNITLCNTLSAFRPVLYI